MKIVKLNKTHKLGQAGFKYAFRFYGDIAKVWKVKHILETMYGPGWSHHWSRVPRSLDTDRWGYFRVDTNSPYWIGTKTEADLTAVILMAGELE